MPFQALSVNQYLVGFHHYWCKGAELKDAAKHAHMNPTHLWRAATGWTGTNGRDGHAGRAAFLHWLKGLRSDEGAPCCGALVVAGDRAIPKLNLPVKRAVVAMPPPDLPPPPKVVQTADAIKDELGELAAEIERLRAQLEGRRTTKRSHHKRPEVAVDTA